MAKPTTGRLDQLPIFRSAARYLNHEPIIFDTMASRQYNTAMKKRKNQAAVKLGRLGGKARGALLKAGLIPVSGAAVPKPTLCPRCGIEQPSARAAWVHCRGRKKDKDTS